MVYDKEKMKKDLEVLANYAGWREYLGMLERIDDDLIFGCESGAACACACACTCACKCGTPTVE